MYKYKSTSLVHLLSQHTLNKDSNLGEHTCHTKEKKKFKTTMKITILIHLFILAIIGFTTAVPKGPSYSPTSGLSLSYSLLQAQSRSDFALSTRDIVERAPSAGGIAFIVIILILVAVVGFIFYLRRAGRRSVDA
jgi:hypothetical protein